jgi:hypothetical protein
LWDARARVSWVEALARRGDSDRAREEATRALAIARENGYGLAESRATRVLEPVAAE